MHVLTLKQPWAWAVFHAGKDVENRPISTGYRGRLYIHAGLKTDLPAIEALRQRGHELPSHFLHGVILGHVDLIACHSSSRSEWAQRDAFHWVIVKPQLLPSPVRHRGLPFLHKRKEPL